MEISFSIENEQYKVTVGNSWFYLDRSSIGKIAKDKERSQQFVTLLFRTLAKKDCSLKFLLSTLD